MRLGIVKLASCIALAALPIVSSAQFSAEPPRLAILVSPYSGGCSVTVSALGSTENLKMKSKLQMLAVKLGGRLVRFAEHKGELPPALLKQYGGLVEVEAELQAPPINNNHAVDISPWLFTFGDLGGFDLLIMAPVDPMYDGLRSFDRPGLSIRLTKDGAPYRYRVLCTGLADTTKPVPIRQAAVQPVPMKSRDVPRRRASDRLWLGLGMSGFALAGLVLLGFVVARGRTHAQH